MSDTAQIASLFEDWNSAIQTGNPDEVTKLYAEDAVLLPTLSNKVRHNHDEIKDYFVNFLARGPVGHIDESNIRLFSDSAVNSGIYTFSFNDDSQAQARFTYVYEKRDGKWTIIGHHSSLMPE